jgi:hypothetical protein
VLKQVVDGFYQGMLHPDHPTLMADGMARALGTKHMQLWFADPAEETFVQHMHWDGAMDVVPGADYSNIVEQNVGGNKLDYFEQQQNQLSVKVKGKSVVDTTALTVSNPVFVPQPHYWLGDSGPYARPMMNVYAPGRAQLLAWKADPLCPVLVTTKNITQAAAPKPCRLDTPVPATWSPGPPEHRERGKKVWSATMQIPAQKEGSLAFTYRVPAAVRRRGDRSVYRLVLQHQPTVRAQDMTVRLQLPAGATGVKAPGFIQKSAGVWVWHHQLDRDTVLAVSWKP